MSQEHGTVIFKISVMVNSILVVFCLVLIEKGGFVVLWLELLSLETYRSGR